MAIIAPANGASESVRIAPKGEDNGGSKVAASEVKPVDRASGSTVIEQENKEFNHMEIGGVANQEIGGVANQKFDELKGVKEVDAVI